MTEKQITEEILRYLKDVSYNYAVLIDGEWIHTRIEMGDGWLLVGVPTDQLVGLVVRI